MYRKTTTSRFERLRSSNDLITSPSNPQPKEEEEEEKEKENSGTKKRKKEKKIKSNDYTIPSTLPRGNCALRRGGARLVFSHATGRGENETAEVTGSPQKCSFPGWRLIAISRHLNRRCALFHRALQTPPEKGRGDGGRGVGRRERIASAVNPGKKKNEITTVSKEVRIPPPRVYFFILRAKLRTEGGSDRCSSR